MISKIILYHGSHISPYISQLSHFLHFNNLISLPRWGSHQRPPSQMAEANFWSTWVRRRNCCLAEVNGEEHGLSEPIITIVMCYCYGVFMNVCVCVCGIYMYLYACLCLCIFMYFYVFIYIYIIFIITIDVIIYYINYIYRVFFFSTYTYHL